jgi:hypothetical protein
LTTTETVRTNGDNGGQRGASFIVFVELSVRYFRSGSSGRLDQIAAWIRLLAEFFPSPR